MTYEDNKDIYKNVKKKFTRLIIPYFIYSGIIFILGIFFQNIKTTREMLLAIIGIFYSRYALYPLNESENVLFLQIGNSPLWFLTSMFIGCMLFYVVMEIARDSMIKTWLCYIGLIVITILFQSFPVLLPWSIDTAFLTAWFMLIGYNMKKKFLKRYSIFYIALVSIIYILGCYWDGAVNLSIRVYGNHGISSIFATCVLGILGSFICLFIAQMIDEFNVIRQVLILVGKNTITILALHMSLFYAFNNILNQLGIFYNDNRYMYYAVGCIRIVITIGVCDCLSGVKKQFNRNNDNLK